MKRQLLHAIAALSVCLSAILLHPLSGLRAAPVVEPGAGWRLAVGHPPMGWIEGQDNPACFDPAHPNVVLRRGGAGTVAYNWNSGQRTAVSPRSFDLCGPAGILFAAPAAGNPAWRFSVGDPTGRAIDHMPTHVAQDGSRIVYSFESQRPHGGYLPGKLWMSEDGGITWSERGREFAGQIVSMAVTQADARALYIAVAERPLEQRRQVAFSIYFSSDAGASWERRYNAVTGAAAFSLFPGLSLKLSTIPGPGAPVGGVTFSLSECPYEACDYGAVLRWFSFDGGRTFSNGSNDYAGLSVRVVHTGEGYLRWSHEIVGGASPREYRHAHRLGLSIDNGKSWQDLPLPEPIRESFSGIEAVDALAVAPAAPASVFMVAAGRLVYSADGGRSWQQLAASHGRLDGITPYLPLSILWHDEDGRLYVRDLAEAGSRNAGAVQPTGAAGTSFYPPTGHNMYRMFKAYWERQGGLAQFGYPISEPFYEVSADGKAYVVQYFQRNRFEYHPENNAPYDVLLGRLGVIMSEPLRKQGHGAFNRFEDKRYEHGIYFPQTGHNLRSSFLDYWQAHGGLAIYGYPISEEFEQVSATDGKTYIVQYFERNRFEYHPEHRGTPNEVQLGLLGNEVLRQRGWIR